MYSVSLLPSEYRAIHQSAKKKDIRLLITMGIMSILAIGYLVLSVTVLNLEKNYQIMQNENVDLLIEIDRFEGLELLNAQVNTLLLQAISAKGSNPKWDDLIASIGNSVPESVGLNTLEMKYNDTVHECVIEGTAKNHQAVSYWMESLENVEGIDGIKCSFLSVQQQEIDTVSKFKLSFSLLEGPGYNLPQEVR